MIKQDDFIGKILGDLTVICKTDKKDKYNGIIYGGAIYRYETQEEAAAAYNLATVMTFEGFDPSIYVLNDTDYPMDKIDTNINFFKKHIPKLKEIALLSYKD